MWPRSRILPYLDLPSDDGLWACGLQARGVTVLPVVWQDASVAWTEFDLILLRSTWDYHLPTPSCNLVPGNLFDFPGTHFRLGFGRTDFSNGLGSPGRSTHFHSGSALTQWNPPCDLTVLTRAPLTHPLDVLAVRGRGGSSLLAIQRSAPLSGATPSSCGIHGPALCHWCGKRAFTYPR